MDMLDVDTEEPLLNLPIPLTPIEQHGSLLTASQITEGERSGDIIYNDDTGENQLVLLRILGKPYAANKEFWTRVWSLSLVLGLLLGLCIGGFFMAIRCLLDRWYADPGLRSHGEIW